MTIAFVAFKFSSKLAPFYAYGAVAVAFIGAATAEQLSGATLVIAFTMEVLLIVLCVLYLTKNIKTAGSASLLFIVPVILSFTSISQYANSHEIFTKDFFVLLLLGISLISVCRIIISSFKLLNQGEEEKEVSTGSVLVVLGIFYFGYIIWELSHIILIGAPDMATMTALLIYTICGIAAYFSGLYSNDMARKTYGIILLAFVVIRLISVDVWQMELFGRVITFLAIGVLLMGTAFLTKRKKHE